MSTTPKTTPSPVIPEPPEPKAPDDAEQRASEVPATKPSSSGAVPASSRRHRAAKQQQTRQERRWATIVATAMGALVMVALIVFYFFPPRSEQRPIVVLIVAVGMGFSFALVGGKVALNFKIPFVGANPVTGSAAGGIGAFLLTLVVANWLFRQNVASEGPKKGATQAPVPFDLRLAIESDARNIPPVIDFRNGTQRAEYVAFQKPLGYYLVHNVVLPVAGGRYEAQFRTVAPDSELVERERPMDRVTNLCFVTNAENKRRPTDGYAFVGCTPGAACAVSSDDPGWVSTCKTTAQRRWSWPVLVRNAYADTSAGPTSHWVSSSLKTLQQRHNDPADNPPFMHFRVTAKSDAPAAKLKGAKFYSVEIRVNGTPVFIDGWRPDEIMQPVDPSGRITYEFALQNLGFSGRDAGFEKVSVAFRWFDDAKHLMGTSEFDRSMVAFRDVPPATTSAGVATFSSTGEYQPSARLDRYSIMLASTPNLEEATSLTRKIDEAGQLFEANHLLAVLRPPLTPWRLAQYSNPNYSVLLGVRKPSGQVSFSFDEEAADKLCRHAYSGRGAFHGGVHATVFRYQWPIPGESTGKDRHRYRLCKEL